MDRHVLVIFFLILKIMGNNYIFLERKDKFLTKVHAC